MLESRITLREDPALTAGYPEGIPNRITVTTSDGDRLVREVRFPRGHARNPMSDDELVTKFRLNVEERLSPAQADAVVEAVMHLESQPGLRHLAERWRL